MLLSIAIFSLAISIKPIKSTWAGGTIYIRADGSIDPLDAPLITYDNITYILTDNLINSGEEVVVKADTYYISFGQVAIFIERDNITIDGNGYFIQRNGGCGIVLYRRTNVTIRNLMMRGLYCGVHIYESSFCSVVLNTIMGSTGEGIRLTRSVSNRLYKNRIENSTYDGVYLSSSHNNSIIKNNITTSKNGILLSYSSTFNNISENNLTYNGNGIELCLPSNYNNISGNVIAHNTHGIQLWRGASNIGPSNNIITKNTIKDNYEGLILSHANNNTVSENNLLSNRIGVWLYNSFNNTFYHNNFVNNTVQIDNRGSNNTWDDGYPSGGNYWSDYAGVDLYSGPYQNVTGSDGIGDTPYVIDEDNVDNYPLMSPWGELPALIPTLAVAPSYYLATHAGETFNVTVRIENLSAASRAVGFQFRLSYNDTLLEVVNVAEGSFLRQFNQTSSPPYTFFVYYIEPETQYPNGTVIPPHVLVGILLMPNSTGDWPGPFPEGNGTLASITFNVTAESAGSCILHLFDTKIVNDEGEINHNVVDGLFEFKPAVAPLYNLTIIAGPGGTTDPPPGTYTYENGSVVLATAIPDAGYVFDYWILDGEMRLENPIEIVMDGHHVLEAHFKEAERKPIAAFIWSPRSPLEGQEVVFDASMSRADGGEIVRYEWSFGDGSRGEGLVITHTYTEAGLYRVTLTVVDSEGLTDSVSDYIFVRPKCFILTAVLGTDAEEDLNYLRIFRDKILKTNLIGKAFVSLYYEASPPIADELSRNHILKALTAALLVRPLVLMVKIILNPCSLAIYVAFACLCFYATRKRKLKALLTIIGFSALTASALSLTVLTLGLIAKILPQASIIASAMLPTIIPITTLTAIIKTLQHLR